MVTFGSPNPSLCKIARYVVIVVNRIQQVWQRIRYLSYYPRFAGVGEGVRLDDDIYINKPENITIGRNTFIGRRCRLNALAKISIGESCLIAAGCTMMTWNHRLEGRSLDIRSAGKDTSPIVIGDGVWMGYDATVLPGVSVGRGAVIGASAVVTKDVKPFEVVVGIPARAIGVRTHQGIRWFE